MLCFTSYIFSSRFVGIVFISALYDSITIIWYLNQIKYDKYDNYMVRNAGKCSFMCLGNNTENGAFLFHNILMENSKEQKVISVIIDNKLNFKSHISELCEKPSQKIVALSRLSSYLHNSDKTLIFNSIIKSQFSYCPLVLMFCSRSSMTF